MTTYAMGRSENGLLRFSCVSVESKNLSYGQPLPDFNADTNCWTISIVVNTYAQVRSMVRDMEAIH